MSITLRIFLILITLIYIFVIIKNISKKKIQLSFSLFWTFTALLLIIALAIPNFIGTISSWLGFQVSTNMIFVVTIFILFVLNFKMSLSFEQEKEKTKKLIQETSLLKKKVEDIEKGKTKE